MGSPGCRSGDPEELHRVVVGTEGVVKLSCEGPVLEDRLKPLHEIVKPVGACEGVPAWIVDDAVLGVQVVQSFEIARVEEFDLPASQTDPLQWTNASSVGSKA